MKSIGKVCSECGSLLEVVRVDQSTGNEVYKCNQCGKIEFN